MPISPENMSIIVSAVLSVCEESPPNCRLKRLEQAMEKFRAWTGWTDAECDLIEATVRDRLLEKP